MDKKEAVLVLALLLIAVAARLPGIDRPMYGDEADWYKSAKIVVDGDERWPNTFVSDNPPLGKATYAAGYWLGIENLRWVALLFGIGSLVLAYMMAHEYLGRNPALVMLALLSILVYHVIASQQVDRDGSMITFFVLLTMYAHFRYVSMRSAGHRTLALVSFMVATLMRTTMLALVLPLLVFEHVKGRVGSAKVLVMKLVPFGIMFLVSIPIWMWLDHVLGLQTLTQKSLDHYLEPLGYDLNTRMLRTLVAGARIVSSLTVPLTLALLLSPIYLRSEWSRLSQTARAFLLANMVWIVVGIAAAAMALRGDPPRYFMVVVPSIAIVVGFVTARAQGSGRKWIGITAVLTLAYLALLTYLDFNNVNLLLMQYAAAGAVVLAAIYWLVDRDLNRLIAMLVVMSIATSAFMLTDFRTYDALRSHAVEDAAAYLNSVGAMKIAESQERTLDLYVTGSVKQYEDVRCVKQDGKPCPKEEQILPVPEGYYVVDFPLKPLELDPDVGAQFRFNLFDKRGVEDCELIRTYMVHSIVVSEFYRC